MGSVATTLVLGDEDNLRLLVAVRVLPFTMSQVLSDEVRKSTIDYSVKDIRAWFPPVDDHGGEQR